MNRQTRIHPGPRGIAAGLVVGKQIGVFGFAWLAIKSGHAHLPAQASWRQLHGIALLCGIGFTMSLFIGGLAFDDGAELMRQPKPGVLEASLPSALIGLVLLRAQDARRAHQSGGFAQGWRRAGFDSEAGSVGDGWGRTVRS